MEPRIIIATIMAADGLGGTQNHFLAFHRYLVSLGLPCSLITPYDQAPVRRFVFRGSLKFLRYASRSLGVWWYEWGFGRLLRRTLRQELADVGPCVIYAQCPVSAWAALAARRGVHQSVVMIAHFASSQAEERAANGLIRTGGWLYRRTWERERRIIAQLDGIVFVSEYSRDILRNRIPEIATIAQLVSPNFVMDPIAPDSPDESRGSTRLPQRDLITIGRLEPAKNQRFILEVLGHARRVYGRRYTLTVVGDGPDRGVLERSSQALGIADQVTFVGWRPNAIALIPVHRAYCHASLLESFGIVVLEAMAWGKPVIAAPTGGIREIFRDGIEGVYWDLEDPADAARGLVDFLDDKMAYERFGQAARARFLSGFEATDVAARLHRFLRERVEREERKMKETNVDPGAETGTA